MEIMYINFLLSSSILLIVLYICNTIDHRPSTCYTLQKHQYFVLE